MSALTIGSVCSGIGGLELGLERAGLGPTRWQIEIDPRARAVLEQHWPNATRLEDLRIVAARASELADVDIICGGTPCQDLSSAGRRAGLRGARSGLWFDMLEIVRAKLPAFVVWENVAGSIRRGLDVVVGGLRDVGYQVVGTRLSAADTGAPHERERVFVVAHLDRAREPQPQRQVGEVGGRPDDVPRWPPPPDVPRVVHGFPGRVDRERALGNSVVPAQAEVVGWLIRDIAAGRVSLS